MIFSWDTGEPQQALRAERHVRTFLLFAGASFVHWALISGSL